MYQSRFSLRVAAALALSLSAASVMRAAPADDQYALAAGHYSQERYSAAVQEFRALITEHGSHPLAASGQFFLAESLLQTGQAKEAEEAFARFTTEHPQHRFAAQASFRIGESAYLRGDYTAALPKLQAFVTAHGAHKLCEYALPYLADCQLETANLKAAAASYQQALRSFPDGALAGECRLGLARVAEASGDVGEARRFYEFLATRGEGPIDEARLNLARLQYQERDYAAAKKLLEPLASASENTPQRTPARHWLGQVLAAEGKIEEARSTWQQAIRDDAAHALAPAMALALAESHRSRGDYDDALSWCERIGRDWSQSACADDALVLQAQLLIELDRAAEAEALAGDLPRRFPRSPLARSALEVRGRALLAQRKFAAAAELLAPLAREAAAADQAHLPYTLALAQIGARQHDAALATLSAIDVNAASDEIHAGVLAAQGSALVALGRGTEAIAPLSQYLADYGQRTEAVKCRVELCAAYAQAKQFDAAQSTWQTLADKHAGEPSLEPMTLYLAEAAAEAGEHERARVWFEYLAADDRPAQVRTRALEGLAWLAQQEKSPAAATEKLDKVLARQPADEQGAELALRRARLLEEQGKHDEALRAYLAWIKNHAGSPREPEALLAAARMHDELQQDREALALLESLLSDHPNFSRKDAANYQLAWVLVDLNRKDDAALRFAKVHDNHRDSEFWASATYHLAEHHVRAKRTDEATKLLDELLAASPGEELTSHALYLQGQAAVTAQKWEQVAAPLQRLLREHPQCDLCLLAEYWLAEADYRQGKLREAGERYLSLSRKAEGRSDDWLPMIPLRRAQVLAHEQRWQDAHDLAVTIAKQHPNFRQQYEVDYLLGRCLGALAKFDAARAAYERVVKSPVGGRSETAAMAQWMIGETYFQQERYDDAIAAYHRTERLFGYPRWQAAALMQAGKCEEARGRYREAIALYAQVLKEHPATTFAAEASQRLRVAEQRATAKQR